MCEPFFVYVVLTSCACLHVQSMGSDVFLFLYQVLIAFTLPTGSKHIQSPTLFMPNP